MTMTREMKASNDMIVTTHRFLTDEFVAKLQPLASDGMVRYNVKYQMKKDTMGSTSALTYLRLLISHGQYAED